jgi:hypothetical protein
MKGVRANLASANLHYANLTCTNLASANLLYANLRGANLASANLLYANLTCANLRGANLASANLAGADLAGADLTDAYLTGADMTNAKLPDFQLPDGDLIVYKKVRTSAGKNRVITLVIPHDARRTASLIGNKCRAEFAFVLKGSGFSVHDPSFKYTEGEMVRSGTYDADIRHECRPGIHFFCTQKEAEEYDL